MCALGGRSLRYQTCATLNPVLCMYIKLNEKYLIAFGFFGGFVCIVGVLVVVLVTDKLCTRSN